MLITKSIIYSHMLLDVILVIRGSKITDNVSMPKSSIMDHYQAENVCKRLDENVNTYKLEWFSVKPESYLSFFSDDENKKRLYENLENYLEDSYFDIFSKYAYIALLVELKEYDTLQSFIQKDFDEFYKVEPGASNFHTLIFLQFRFRHSKPFELRDLEEFFFRYKISGIYNDFLADYKNTDMFFYLFPYIISDQIDYFFKNNKESVSLRRITHKVHSFISHLTDKNMIYFNTDVEKSFYRYFTEIHNFFELKLNERIEKRCYDIVCIICYNVLRENDKFRNFLLSKCQTNQENSIFKNLEAIICKKTDPSSKSTISTQFTIKNAELVQFLQVAKSTEIYETIRNSIKFDLLIVQINFFYRCIGFEGPLFSICNCMFGTFIISAIIIHHEEQKECSSNDLLTAWALMEINFKEHLTELLFVLFSMSKGYFRLIIAHLNYDYINYSLKCMSNNKYNHNLLIEIIFGRYYYVKEKERILTNLKSLNQGSKELNRHKSIFKSRVKPNPDGIELDYFSKISEYKTFSNKSDMDSATIQNAGYENTRVGREVMFLVVSICEILQKREDCEVVNTILAKDESEKIRKIMEKYSSDDIN